MIDSWDSCERQFIPLENPMEESIRNEITGDVFHLAQKLSDMCRVKSPNELRAILRRQREEHFTSMQAWTETLNALITEQFFDVKEVRNGCEAWQAFLAVVHLGLQGRKRLQRETYDEWDGMLAIGRSWMDLTWRIAVECALMCLNIRRNRSNNPKENLDLERIIDMLEVTEDDREGSGFAQTCLKECLSLESTSYYGIRHADDQLEIAIREMTEGLRLSGNLPVLLDVHGAIERRKVNIEERSLILALSQHDKNIPPMPTNPKEKRAITLNGQDVEVLALIDRLTKTQLEPLQWD